MASKQQVAHLWPVSYVLRNWQMGSPFIRSVQKGVLNYVAARSCSSGSGSSIGPPACCTAGGGSATCCRRVARNN